MLSPTRRVRRILGVLAAPLCAACSDATAPAAPVPTSLTVSVGSVTFSALGRAEQLTVTVRDQNGQAMSGVAVQWTSSASAVATVTSTGLVTAVGNGAATISVSAGQAVQSVSVAVAQAAASVVLVQDSIVLQAPGDTASLAAEVFDAEDFAVSSPTITWSSSDTTVVRVSTNGVLTAVESGTVTITATSGGALAQAIAHVVPELTLVAVSPTSVSGQVNSQVTLSVQVTDLLGASYAGAAVTWSTDAGSGSIPSGAQSASGAGGYTAAVWRLGTVAGLQRATARLVSRGDTIDVAFTATAQPGAAVSALLMADSVLISARGETAYLSPTYRDTFQNVTVPSGITWTSRVPAVATVSVDGLVTGQTAGTTYVVAAMPSSTDSILVTVAMRGAITITFDDGFITAYSNAWPVFQEFGLPGNIAVNPAQVGFPAYMTKSNLDELHAAGWSIVSHTMTHDSLTSQTAGELDWELRESKEWIDAQGYNGSNVFVVPYHVWGMRERDAVGGYYEATRGTSAAAVMPESLVPWRPPNPYDLTGIDAEALPYTTPQGRDRLRALLQRTAAEGAFLDVYLHHLPAGNVQAFRDMLTVIDEFRERVLPYHALYPRFARAVQ